ncbi:rRNA-processing protein EBP2 [Purpureocillium takamizusanense]|uniref:rRNA-processing protein EBP2 n=1 Tax=Purpureocillium takamizusanense TaxID=2060973 RepID=A0A9Q8VBP9_9HYPO|nr:rRNA-processing protein EBP2 [Purpureocillium takamizusanense]UNI19176.1 rRNA-processing protein EBP2 [Purpureocillium takamizusanense]
MVTKSKLRLALAAEKGVDFNKVKQEKQHKAALKRKRAEVEQEAQDPQPEEPEKGESLDDEDEDEDEEEDAQATLNLDGVDDSDTSESSIELEEKITRVKKPSVTRRVPSADDDRQDEDDDSDEDIPVSDLEDLDDEDKEDLIPHSRLTINNTAALQAVLDRIALPTDKSVPFASHQTILATADTADSIPDVSDDLQRELAFYTQCRDAALSGRSKLLAEGVPFSRPKDYFAEMVKEDAHMDKVKAKLLEEASAKKAAAEARKLRDLKKFGKQVQVAKLQERQKEKRETLEKIKTLKRKRQESGGDLGTNEADMFDVGVESELAKHSQRSAGKGKQSQSHNTKRQKKNEKFGFGGKKRHAKSGDALSSGDLSGFNAKQMKASSGRPKGKAQRPGKARRKAMGTR